MMDADNLPREGIDSQHIVEGLSLKYRQGNVDGILRNLPQIMRATGARQPIRLTNLPSASTQQLAAEQQPQQQQNEPITIPSDGKIRLPKPKMMPGSETEPGKPVSNEDIQAFDAKVGLTTPPPSGLQGFDIPPLRHNVKTAQNMSVQSSEPKFFQDVAGNKYKMVGDSLYVMGWQDSELRIRMVSEKTGKEVPSSGKKFQIYGWHLVNKVIKTDTVDKLKATPDIDRVERELDDSNGKKKHSSPSSRKSEAKATIKTDSAKKTDDVKCTITKESEKPSQNVSDGESSIQSIANEKKPTHGRKKLI